MLGNHFVRVTLDRCAWRDMRDAAFVACSEFVRAAIANFQGLDAAGDAAAVVDGVGTLRVTCVATDGPRFASMPVSIVG
jgi:hypothetical protein